MDGETRLGQLYCLYKWLIVLAYTHYFAFSLVTCHDLSHEELSGMNFEDDLTTWLCRNAFCEVCGADWFSVLKSVCVCHFLNGRGPHMGRKTIAMQNLTQLGAVLSISAERGKQCYSQFEVSGRSPSDQRSSQSFFEAGLACSSLCYRSQWNIKAFSGADQFMVFMASGRKKGSDTRIVAIMRGSVRFCISLFHFVRCLFKFTHFFYHCEDFLVKNLEQFFFFQWAGSEVGLVRF